MCRITRGQRVSGLDAATMTRIEREIQCRAVGIKNGRAWIVNEVHGLNAVQVRKLLSLIEPAGGAVRRSLRNSASRWTSSQSARLSRFRPQWPTVRR